MWWRSLLVSSCRGAPRRDRGRRDYIWRCRTGTSPSGRVVCLCVILMLFAGSRVPRGISGFALATWPHRPDDDDARVRPRDVRGLHGATGRLRGPDPDAVAPPRRDPLPAAVRRVDRAGPRVRTDKTIIKSYPSRTRASATRRTCSSSPARRASRAACWRTTTSPSRRRSTGA